MSSTIYQQREYKLSYIPAFSNPSHIICITFTASNQPSRHKLLTDSASLIAFPHPQCYTNNQKTKRRTIMSQPPSLSENLIFRHKFSPFLQICAIATKIKLVARCGKALEFLFKTFFY